MPTHNAPSLDQSPSPEISAIHSRLEAALAPEPKPSKPKQPSRPAPAPATYQIPALHLIPPDALVLCMVDTECMVCGTTFTYPSAHLMLRRGRHIHATQQSRESLSALPREVHHVRANCRMCPRCFQLNPDKDSPECEKASRFSSAPQPSNFLSLSTRTSANSSRTP